MNSHLAGALTTVSALAGGASADLSRTEGVSADPARPGFTFKAGKTLSVSEPVRIPREVSSVCAFNVQDGPADVDVALNGGVFETGGPCGIAKEGPGALKVMGEIRLSGFFTIYQGRSIYPPRGLKDGSASI